MADLNSPIFLGDVTGGLHTTKVEKLQNKSVSATAPTAGQTLVWNGTAWAPATPSTGGGGGANGLTYYLNQSTDADAPVTGIPGTPKQLGRTGQVTQVDVTTGTLTPDTWTLVAGFVSEATPQDPATTLIPAGLWDFNIWTLGVADQNHSNSIRVRAYIYNGTTLTALGTSAVQAIGSTSQQYSVSMLVEQTSMLATDRIYVAIEALATANGHTVTAQFGDNTPSHVHTSLGLIGGTGLWKNTAGVLQSPASLLVNADVDDAAAIAQSKIANLTDDLGNKAGNAQVQVFTSSGTWTKPTGAKSVQVTLIGGGGGGGSGRRGASGTAISGGGGGAGGGYSVRTLEAAILPDTIAVVVAAGGAGGAAATADGTSGSIGIAGTMSQFGTFAFAAGGNPGAGGTNSPATGGSAASQRAMFGGGTGANSSVTAAGSASSNTQVGGCGGGAGGGISTVPAFLAGGAGAIVLSSFSTGSPIAGGLTDGASGSAGLTVTTNYPACGGGGSGGAGSLLGTGGTGGAGGNYGGGGGGGGGSLNGNNSGAGGKGGDGLVVVTTYF